MSGCKTFVSEVGSPRHASGEGSLGRNWSCGCKPGILGPPVSPIPPILRSTIEAFAAGPPSSWKLSYANSLIELNLTWTTTSENPSNRSLIFPPPLLTAIASLPSEPTTWSIEQDAHTLLCKITWPTIPSTAAVPASSSTPFVESPNLNDSGYSSPSSPTSPVPFNLPSSRDYGSQTSPNISQTSTDAATSTTTPISTAASCQTVSSNSFPIDAGVQTSTDASSSTSASCQTMSSSSFPLDAGVQTSSTTLTNASTATTAPATTELSTQTTPDEPKPTNLAEPPAVVTVAANEPAAVVGKKKRRKRSKTTKPILNFANTLPKPACSDATTSYDPPIADRDICRLCCENVSPQTSVASHLLACEGLPDATILTREGFLKNWAEATTPSADILTTLAELHLEHYSSEDVEPDHGITKTDYLVGQLLPRSFPDYDMVLAFQSDLTRQIKTLTAAARKQLHLHHDAKLDLFRPYPVLPITHEDNDEAVLERCRYHPMDDIEDEGSYTSEQNSDYEIFNDEY